METQETFFKSNIKKTVEAGKTGLSMWVAKIIEVES
jgi:hypothetical protein